MAVVVALDEKQLMEMEEIVIDKDQKGALEFVTRLLRKIHNDAKLGMTTPAHHPENTRL